MLPEKHFIFIPRDSFEALWWSLPFPSTTLGSISPPSSTSSWSSCQSKHPPSVAIPQSVAPSSPLPSTPASPSEMEKKAGENNKALGAKCIPFPHLRSSCRRLAGHIQRGRSSGRSREC